MFIFTVSHQNALYVSLRYKRVAMHFLRHKLFAKLFWFNILNCALFTSLQLSFGNATVNQWNSLKLAAGMCIAAFKSPVHTHNKNPLIKTLLHSTTSG